MRSTCATRTFTAVRHEQATEHRPFTAVRDEQSTEHRPFTAVRDEQSTEHRPFTAVRDEQATEHRPFTAVRHEQSTEHLCEAHALRARLRRCGMSNQPSTCAKHMRYAHVHGGAIQKSAPIMQISVISVLFWRI